MNDRERELYRQVQCSLRRIGRSQMTFDRINEEIKSHDKLRLIEQQNRNHREQRRLHTLLKSKEASETLESGSGKPLITASKVSCASEIGCDTRFKLRGNYNERTTSLLNLLEQEPVIS